jgi:diadenosine tetraphosphatase ApaH/serine/threonine PP2A family protein phosphatase
MTRRLLVSVALAAVLAALLSFGPEVAAQSPAPSSCGIENVERIVAIGDVHGAYDTYLEILQTAGLIDRRQRWIGGKTHFVQLGDMVDRGPDSRKVLDLARKLEREAPSRGGGRAHILLGNHETGRMLGDLRYVSAGEYKAFVNAESEDVRTRFATLLSPQDPEGFAKSLPLGSAELQLAFGARGDYGRWLRTLNAVARINGIMFMHGGLSPLVAATPCDDINAAVRRELTTDFQQTLASLQTSLAAGENGPLWYRGLANQPDDFEPTVDEILKAQGAKAIVIAHTTTLDGRVRVRFGGKVTQIDTGMLNGQFYPAGRASALEIKGGQVTAIYQDRKDPLNVPALVTSAP